MCSNCLDLRLLDLQNVHMCNCFFGCVPNFLAKDTQNLQQVLYHYPGWGGLYHFRVAWTHYFWIWKQENFGEMMGKRQETSCRFLVSSLRWSAWSPCDKSCHGGQSHRQRRIMHFNFHGGQCPVQSLQEWDVGKLYV